MDCPARGQKGEGNIRIHCRKRARYRCTVCRQTFSDRAGTIFFRRRTEEETITRVITLVSHGCPVPAVEAAFGFQAQTVREWVDAAGSHAEAVHHAEVVQPRDLVQVQADEIHVKSQAGVLWMAMAMMVSTRLWLGGAVSPQRDRDLIGRLVALVAACATWGPLLFVTDGLSTYIDVVRKAFRTRQAGTGGDRAGGQAVRWASGDGRHPSPGSWQRADVPDVAVVDAWVSGAQHRVYRAAEWHLPQPTGGLGPSHALFGPPCGDGDARHVSGGDGVQLLLCAYQSDLTRWRPADAGHGGRDHGSRLERGRIAAPARPACALGAAAAARSAVAGAPSPH